MCIFYEMNICVCFWIKMRGLHEIIDDFVKYIVEKDKTRKWTHHGGRISVSNIHFLGSDIGTSVWVLYNCLFRSYKHPAVLKKQRDVKVGKLLFPVVPDVLDIVIPRAKPSVGKPKTCCKSSSFQFCASPKVLFFRLCMSQPI